MANRFLRSAARAFAVGAISLLTSLAAHGQVTLTARGNTNYATPAASPCNVTPTGAIAAGTPALVVFYIPFALSTITGISDGTSNTWTIVTNQTGGGTAHKVIGYTSNVAGITTSNAVSLAWSGGTLVGCAANLFQANNLVTAYNDGVSANLSNTGTSINSNAVTPTSATSSSPDTILGIVTIEQTAISQAVTWGSGFSSLSSNAPVATNRAGLWIGTLNATTASPAGLSAALSVSPTSKWDSVNIALRSSGVSCSAYAVDGGCSGVTINGTTYSAPINGNYQNPSAFTPSSTLGIFGGQAQSGQAYVTTPLTGAAQNVPGVTYSDGIPSNVVVGSITGTALTVTQGAIALTPSYNATMDEGHGGVLQGTHITSCTDPQHCTVDKSQNTGAQTFYVQNFQSPSVLPTLYPSCSTGAAISPSPSPAIYCTGAVPVVVDQIDFCRSDVGGVSTFLQFQNTTSVVIKHSKFCMDTDLDKIGGAGTPVGSQFGNTAFLVRFVSSLPDTEYENFFDSCGIADPYCPVGFRNVDHNQTTGTLTTYPTSVIWAGGASPNTLTLYNVMLGTDGRVYARAHATCTAVSPGITVGKANPACDQHTTRFNVVAVTTYGTNAAHGEYSLAGVGNSCVSLCNEVYLEDYEYNLLLAPGSANTAEDGVAITATANGTSTLAVTAGTLSPIRSTYTISGAGIPANTSVVSISPTDWNHATSLTMSANAMATATGVSLSFSAQSVNFTGDTTSGSPTIANVRSGALSAMTAKDPVVQGANIAASTTGHPSSGDLSPVGWSGASALLLSTNAAGSGTGLVRVYGGPTSGNAVTAMIAPWGSAVTSGVQVDNTVITGNVAIANLAAFFGDSSLCSAQYNVGPPIVVTAGPPCFPTLGTNLVSWTHDFTLNATVNNNWLDSAGAFEPYFMSNCGAALSCNGSASAATGQFTAHSTAFVSTASNIPVGWFLVDDTTQKFQGGPAAQVFSANGSIACPSGLTGSCFSYTLVLPAPSGGGVGSSQTFYFRNVGAIAMSGNINMPSGAACNGVFRSSSFTLLNLCGGEYP